MTSMMCARLDHQALDHQVYQAHPDPDPDLYQSLDLDLVHPRKIHMLLVGDFLLFLRMRQYQSYKETL